MLTVSLSNANMSAKNHCCSLWTDCADKISHANTHIFTGSNLPDCVRGMVFGCVCVRDGVLGKGCREGSVGVGGGEASDNSILSK